MPRVPAPQVSARRAQDESAWLAPDLMARVRTLQLRTHRLVNTALTGSYRSVFRGQGIEFEEVRPYLPGDDVRGIDWNVTARTGEPHVKSYREERELSIHCLVDTGLSMDFGTRRHTRREAAAQLVGLFAMVAIRNQDRVGLTLFGREPGVHLPPRKSSRHILRLIREVVAAPVEDGRSDLAAVLEETGRALHRRSLVLVLSDFADAGSREALPHLRRLAARHDVIGVRLVDPFEERLPDAGLFAVGGLDGRGWVEVDSGDAGVREDWERAAAARRAAFHGLFNEARADRFDVDLGEELSAPVARFFHLRAQRTGGRR